MRKLAALVKGLVADPYVLTVVGSLCLLRGLDAMAAQAREVATQAQAAQQQWAQMYAAMAQASAVQSEANGFDVRPTSGNHGQQQDGNRVTFRHNAQPVPDVSGKDVAGEREDLHP
jgi:hypothetical protein